MTALRPLAAETVYVPVGTAKRGRLPAARFPRLPFGEENTPSPLSRKSGKIPGRAPFAEGEFPSRWHNALSPAGAGAAKSGLK